MKRDRERNRECLFKINQTKFMCETETASVNSNEWFNYLLKQASRCATDKDVD